MDNRVIYELGKLGFAYHDAVALGRIAGTLRRWYAMECGMTHGRIERDEDTGAPYFYSSLQSYLDPHDPRYRSRIPDREKGALKRLAKIMAGYPDCQSYIQGDPRGAVLYILPATMSAEEADKNHASGQAVY